MQSDSCIISHLSTVLLHHDTALIPNAAERGGQKCAPMTPARPKGCPKPEFMPLSLCFPYACALPPQHAAPCLTLSCPSAGSALFLKHLWTCPTRPLSAPMPPPLFDALESTTSPLRSALEDQEHQQQLLHQKAGVPRRRRRRRQWQQQQQQPAVPRLAVISERWRFAVELWHRLRRRV